MAPKKKRKKMDVRKRVYDRQILFASYDSLDPNGPTIETQREACHALEKYCSKGKCTVYRVDVSDGDHELIDMFVVSSAWHAGKVKQVAEDHGLETLAMYGLTMLKGAEIDRRYHRHWRSDPEPPGAKYLVNCDR
jgi:hypothetical protein